MIDALRARLPQETSLARQDAEVKTAFGALASVNRSWKGNAVECLDLIDLSNDYKRRALDAGKKCNALAAATGTSDRKARLTAKTAIAVSQRVAFSAGLAGYLDALALFKCNVGPQPMRDPRRVIGNLDPNPWTNDPFGDRAEEFAVSARYRATSEGAEAVKQCGSSNQKRIQELQDLPYLLHIPPYHKTTYGYEVAKEAYQLGFNRAALEHLSAKK